MQNNERLKLCPFCGAKGYILSREYPITLGGGTGYWVICSRCGGRAGDADKLIRRMRIDMDRMKYQYNLDVIEGMSLAIGYIVGSPTVYYMDKVVEQLNELLEEKTSDSGEDWYTAECLGRAIEIVKRGGRDD